MLEQELAGLETFGQFEADGVPDGALAGESDQRARFREGDVALQGEAGGHASHGWIGEDGDI